MSGTVQRLLWDVNGLGGRLTLAGAWTVEGGQNGEWKGWNVRKKNLQFTDVLN
jgi:hypothetical protein